MGSTTTSHCWRGRSTSFSANLPHAESSEDMFDFVFGDQKYPSNMSSREGMAVVSGVRCKEVCEVGRGDVVGKPELFKRTSTTSTMSVSSSLPHADSVETKSDTVVRKPQNDISVFATPLPPFVEQRQRRISKQSEASTETGGSTKPQPPTCTIIEEGREWYGYRDEGIRQAAEMFGVVGPWIRPSCGTGDVNGIKRSGEEGKGEVKKEKKEKKFWHGNGRKVGVNGSVEERWMCVGDDEFGIGEELVVVDSESEESVNSDDVIPERSQYSEERPWWSVRWKNVFVMLGCGVRA